MSAGIHRHRVPSSLTTPVIDRPATRYRANLFVVVLVSTTVGCITVEPATPFQAETTVDTQDGQQQDTENDTLSPNDIVPSGDFSDNDAFLIDGATNDSGSSDPCTGPSPCPAGGLCADRVIATCTDGRWTCDVSNVIGYEADEETTCDNLDNDCDGYIDEFLFDPTTSDCAHEGVCTKGLFTFCMNGVWHCDYSMVPGYESKEETCDGKDNDCDGITDEGTFDPITAGCKTAGVCTSKVTALCEDGDTVCDYSPIGSIYENPEQSCDGLDNDCDGQTDEVFVVGVTDNDCVPEAPAAGPCCDTAGVCVGKVNATCAGGTWTCNYNSVLGFQAKGETSCDGKDNDCDGETDEPFSLDPNESTCPSAGLCVGTVAKCIGGKWDCGFENVEGYEQSETSCDNIDNDCDGQTDEGIIATSGPTTIECLNVGVCAVGVPVVCLNGTWVCNSSGVTGYELTESICDGLDNDCDGDVDETVAPPTAPVADCTKLGIGVCLAETSVVCKDGKYGCNWANNLDYESTETSCDGKDNDCDGKIDQDLPPPPPGTCPSVGVCAAGVDAVCTNAEWVCETASILHYEANELTCDGLDNDCDGQIDENLTDVASSTCKQVGVCAVGVITVCNQGKWFCDYSGVTDYSGSTEYTCDGKDNDCDGIVDEQTCADGTLCDADDICASGFCATALDGSGGLCTDGLQCAQSVDADGPGGVSVPSGDFSCVDDNHIAECENGNWGKPIPCDNETPYCFQGLCTLCLPGQSICDGLIGTKTCNDTGTDFDSGPTCKPGNVCVGAGVCVVPGEQPVSSDITTNQSLPAAATLNQQGFVITWMKGGVVPGETSDIRFRPFAADGQPTGPEKAPAVQSGVFATQPAISTIVGGFLIGWHQHVKLPETASGWVRAFSPTGIPLGAETSVALPKGEQFGLATHLSISPLGPGYMVTWDTQMSGLAGLDVFSRRFESSGIPLGNPMPLTGLSPGDQTTPASAQLVDGTVVVVWRSTSPSGPQTLFGARLDQDGVLMGTVVALTDPAAGKAAFPAIAPTANGFLLIYELVPPETTDAVIRGRFHSFDLQPQGTFLDISAKDQGDHRKPAIANIPSLGFAVVYETTGPTTDATDLVLRRFTPLGTPTASPVNPTVNTTADQIGPRVLAYEDGRLVIVWTTLTSQAGDTTAHVRFRVFGFY